MAGCRSIHLAASLFLLQAMGAPGVIDRLVYGEWDDKGGDKISLFFNLMQIAVSLYLFARGYQKAKRVRTGALLAIGLVGFMLASALWSVDPQTTVRRGISYLFTVLGAIGIAGNLEEDEFMGLLLATCGFSAISSIALLALSPGAAVMPESGEFRGIFTHKNALGQVMAIGALASLHCLRVDARNRVRDMLFLSVFVANAFASRSATSYLVTFAFCAMAGVTALYQKGGATRTFSIALACLLVPCGIIASFASDSILELIGKDPTLTGRTELWAYVVADISQRPLLGWGYYAFWSPLNPASDAISDALRWHVPQAHNGLLEILLNFGVVGAGFFVFLWIRNIWLTLQCLRTQARVFAASSLFLYVGLILVGVTETVMMEPFEITTNLFFIMGLMCESSVRSARQSQYGQRSLDDARFAKLPLDGVGGQADERESRVKNEGKNFFFEKKKQKTFVCLIERHMAATALVPN